MALGAQRIFQQTTQNVGGQATVSAVIRYVPQNYSESRIAYVGPDNLNRPVFLFAYGNSSNLLRAVLFRINNNGTVTEGSEQSGGAQTCGNTVKCMSEYEGANSFGNNTPTNYAYLSYNDNNNNYKVQAVLADPTNLTCTFGTAVNVGILPDADQPLVAYVGNSRCVGGGREDDGTFLQRFSRSGTTLTSEGTSAGDTGTRIDNDLLGFDWDGSSRYRMGQVSTANNAIHNTISAVQLGSTNYIATDSTLTSEVFNMGCNLNNTNKMLGFGTAVGTNYLRAISITWNDAAVPSISIGTANTNLNDISVGACVVSGHSVDEAYVLYSSSSSTLDYRRVTVSGTTVTIGSKINMISNLSSLNSIIGSSAMIGNRKYFAGVNTRTSGAPYIFGYKFF